MSQLNQYQEYQTFDEIPDVEMSLATKSRIKLHLKNAFERMDLNKNGRIGEDALVEWLDNQIGFVNPMVGTGANREIIHKIFDMIPKDQRNQFTQRSYEQLFVIIYSRLRNYRIEQKSQKEKWKFAGKHYLEQESKEREEKNPDGSNQNFQDRGTWDVGRRTAAEQGFVGADKNSKAGVANQYYSDYENDIAGVFGQATAKTNLWNQGQIGPHDWSERNLRYWNYMDESDKDRVLEMLTQKARLPSLMITFEQLKYIKINPENISIKVTAFEDTAENTRIIGYSNKMELLDGFHGGEKDSLYWNIDMEFKEDPERLKNFFHDKLEMELDYLPKSKYKLNKGNKFEEIWKILRIKELQQKRKLWEDLCQRVISAKEEDNYKNMIHLQNRDTICSDYGIQKLREILDDALKYLLNADEQKKWAVVKANAMEEEDNNVLRLEKDWNDQIEKAFLESDNYKEMENRKDKFEKLLAEILNAYNTAEKQEQTERALRIILTYIEYKNRRWYGKFDLKWYENTIKTLIQSMRDASKRNTLLVYLTNTQLELRKNGKYPVVANIKTTPKETVIWVKDGTNNNSGHFETDEWEDLNIWEKYRTKLEHTYLVFEITDVLHGHEPLEFRFPLVNFQDQDKHVRWYDLKTNGVMLTDTRARLVAQLVFDKAEIHNIMATEAYRKYKEMDNKQKETEVFVQRVQNPDSKYTNPPVDPYWGNDKTKQLGYMELQVVFQSSWLGYLTSSDYPNKPTERQPQAYYSPLPFQLTWWEKMILFVAFVIFLFCLFTVDTRDIYTNCCLVLANASVQLVQVNEFRTPKPVNRNLAGRSAPKNESLITTVLEGISKMSHTALYTAVVLICLTLIALGINITYEVLGFGNALVKTPGVDKGLLTDTKWWAGFWSWGMLLPLVLLVIFLFLNRIFDRHRSLTVNF